MPRVHSMTFHPLRSTREGEREGVGEPTLCLFGFFSVLCIVCVQARVSGIQRLVTICL
jgi:hypothetical protein